MHVSDIYLVAPALILGAVGWFISWLGNRSNRRFRAELARKAAAE